MIAELWLFGRSWLICRYFDQVLPFVKVGASDIQDLTSGFVTCTGNVYTY